MYTSGTSICVAWSDNGPTYWITIEKSICPVKGVGWLCRTKEGNNVLVMPGDNELTKKVRFIIDQQEYMQLLEQKDGV